MITLLVTIDNLHIPYIHPTKERNIPKILWSRKAPPQKKRKGGDTNPSNAFSLFAHISPGQYIRKQDENVAMAWCKINKPYRVPIKP